ncbi:unnamed protein product [Bursaphelenchus okinawaensis]|uniref:Carboxylesterase type B domain-containing protein n=1 Tax=Bursaphelenchus okinawaensis TaxID=465554 RepID=A0A811KPU1_9BILA|nr:unnamed protein product [Bursaphelenchus okinawaensis]CAG9110675.1 unnamed protein product [Bursaphelenchus okinawaensis]
MAKTNILMGKSFDKGVRKAGFIAVCICFGLAVPLIFLWNSERIGEQTLTKVSYEGVEIIGRKLQMTDGDYFTGIKYGSAKRFESPKMVDFDSPTVATFWPKDCFGKKNKKGAEDCLYLNVYKCRNLAKILPVLVLLNVGPNTQNLDPTLLTRNLACRGMILVTVSYRKGAMGNFGLNYDDKRVAQEVEDVTLALKWVQNTIKAFRGNSRNVTVFGAGGGGRIVELLSKDPDQEPLFHKVIQTQAALQHPSLYTSANQMVVENSLKLANMLNCTDVETIDKLSDHEIDRIYNCTKSHDRKTIHEQLLAIASKGDDFPLDSSMFYTNNTLSKNRNLPTLIGSCFRRQKPMNESKVGVDTLRELLNDLPDFKNFLYKQELVDYYVEQFGGKASLEQAMKQIRFDYHTLSRLLIRAMENKHTFYFHSTGFCIENLLFNSHNENRNDKAQHFFADAIINFVRSGNPNPRKTKLWPRYRSNSTTNVLSMSNQGFVAQPNPFPEIGNFWLCKMAQYTGLKPMCN